MPIAVHFGPFRRGDKRRVSGFVGHAAASSGVVVQSVRIPACHAGGRGFESRPLRQQYQGVSSLMTRPESHTVWIAVIFGARLGNRAFGRDSPTPRRPASRATPPSPGAALPHRRHWPTAPSNWQRGGYSATWKQIHSRQLLGRVPARYLRCSSPAGSRLRDSPAERTLCSPVLAAYGAATRSPPCPPSLTLVP